MSGSRTFLRQSFLLPSLLVLGLTVRLGMLAVNYNNLDLDSSFVVGGEIAHNILRGRGIAVDTAHMAITVQMWRREQRLIDFQDLPAPSSAQVQPEFLNEPGYGLLLAGLWKLTGSERWITVRLLQILIDVGMIAAVFFIGTALGGRRAGAVAALLYAVFIPHIELVVRPHRDVWVSFAYILSVVLLMRWNRDERGGWKWIVMLGVMFGLVAWMRSTVVAYVVFCAILMIVLKRRWKTAAQAALLGGVFLLLMTPLVVRNYEAFGRVMLTRGAVWHSFWAGVGQFSNPYGLADDDAVVIRYFEAKDTSVQYGTEGYERFLRQEAMKLFREHPWWYAGMVVRRAAVILAPKIGRELFFQTSQGTVTGILNQRLSRWLLFTADLVFVAGFLAGIWITRLRGREVLIILLPWLYTFLTLAPFYVVGRNILNSYVVVLVFASAAFAASIWRNIQMQH